jgi:hypothetical protein
MLQYENPSLIVYFRKSFHTISQKLSLANCV